MLNESGFFFYFNFKEIWYYELPPVIKCFRDTVFVLNIRTSTTMLAVQYWLAFNLLFYTLTTCVVPTTIFHLCYCSNSRSEKKRTSYTMLAFDNCAPSISFHAKQILWAYFKFLFIYLQIRYNKLKYHESFRVIFSLCYICIFTYYSNSII